MTAELITLGISHKTAPVQLRERLALTQGDVPGFLREVVDHPEVHEAVVISTCNRTELTLVVGDAVAGETAALGILAQRAHVRPTELAGKIYSPRNCDAARQLFRVSSGLESMIVGEAEIQGQVKRAYEIALEAGTTGPMTNRLFTAALQTGKRGVVIDALEPVGHYAVKPTFSDGHDSGLFTWDYLYRLGSQQDELFAQYLERLALAGLDRDADMTPPAGAACHSH